MTLKKIFIFIVTLSLINLKGVWAEESKTVWAGGFVDVHMHLDGVQGKMTGQRQTNLQKKSSEAPWMPPKARKRMAMQRQTMMRQQQTPAGDNTASADHLIAMMDQYGVRKAIVMPPPQTRGRPGAYPYTALLDSVKKYPERLILGAGGGELNPMIQETNASEVNEKILDAFKAKAVEIVRSGAHVFGEMTALHTCMNPKHLYEASPPDHPLFFLLADLAAQYDIPIDLHMEAIAEDLPTPEKLLQACSQNPPALSATLPAFERLLEHNRRARIVWQHIGWDNIGQMTPPLMHQLLAKHPNLYLAIKAVPKADAARMNRIHDDNYTILPEWLELFESFPDRIVVGADEFARAENVRGGYKKPPFFDVTWQTVMNLPPKLQKQIGGENAARIYRL